MDICYVEFVCYVSELRFPFWWCGSTYHLASSLTICLALWVFSKDLTGFVQSFLGLVWE